MMIYGWRERELVLAFLEKTTGLRMNHNYIRPGGVAAVFQRLAARPRGLGLVRRGSQCASSADPIWLERTVRRGVPPEIALAPGPSCGPAAGISQGGP
jgi:NADH:ubiquinone oxidoreductase subunit D